MRSYKIVIKRSAAKELQKITPKDRDRLIECIRDLATDPRPTNFKGLSGQGKYRIRQGNYRILYRVEDDVLIITVVKIGHRRDVYK
jgi:mRNA interferase RelE/StbE